MFKHQYQIQVKWEDNWRTISPKKVTIEATPNSTKKELLFDSEGVDYKYVWESNPTQGLSWLYKMNTDPYKSECVYDAYMRQVKPDHAALHEAARELLRMIKEKL